MNRLATIEHEGQAAPYSPVTYAAFQISDSGRTYALGELAAGSLAEALNEVVSQFALSHKQHLLVREGGERGVKLHLFAIRKKSNPRYVYKDHVSRAVYDLYAAPVCTMDGSVLAVSL